MKKLIALLLVFTLLLSTMALAAAGGTVEAVEPTATETAEPVTSETAETVDGEPAGYDVRDTEFFVDGYHAEVMFEDIEFVLVDVDAAVAAADEVRELCTDSANLEEVLLGILTVADEYATALTMNNLASIYLYKDVTSTENAENYALAQEVAVVLADETAKLVRDVLLSPCASAMDELLTEELREQYLAYEDISEEMKALIARRTELENEYLQNEYLSYVSTEAKNEVQGAVYLELLDVWEQIAALEGYDNYGTMMYEAGYLRDYTRADLEPYYAAVKEHIVPLYAELEEILEVELLDDAFYADYTGDYGLDLVEPYIAALSDEMLEAFRYMRDYNMWDNEPSYLKGDMGFVTTLDAYGAPYFFDSPYEDITALFTVVHEFGHYNAAYWLGSNNSLLPQDTAEVHSQALELLMFEFYPELFGEDATEDIVLYNLTNMLDSIIQGALFDELQWYTVTTEDVTLEQINEKFCELAKEYGRLEPESESTELYGWVNIPHNFSSPFYYISYSTSAAGALVFWLESQEDYFTAVDKYLEFTSLGVDYYFRENFEAVGLESPLGDGFLAELAASLDEALDVDALYAARIALIEGFEDVAETDWFYDAVTSAAYYGYVTAADRTFNPNDKLSWAETVTFAVRVAQAYAGESAFTAADQTEVWYEIYTDYALENGIIDEIPSDPNADITRGDAAEIFAEVLGGYLVLNDIEDGYFTDVPADSPEYDAVYALARAGIANGKGGGEFGTNDTILRSEAVMIVARMVGITAPASIVPDAQ